MRQQQVLDICAGLDALEHATAEAFPTPAQRDHLWSIIDRIKELAAVVADEPEPSPPPPNATDHETARNIDGMVTDAWQAGVAAASGRIVEHQERWLSLRQRAVAVREATGLQITTY